MCMRKQETQLRPLKQERPLLRKCEHSERKSIQKMPQSSSTWNTEIKSQLDARRKEGSRMNHNRRSTSITEAEERV